MIKDRTMSSDKENETNINKEESTLSVYWKAITDKNARVSENESYLSALVTLNIVLLICLVLPYLTLKLYLVHKSDLNTLFTYDELHNQEWSIITNNEYTSSIGLHYTKLTFDYLIKKPLRWMNFTKFGLSNFAQLRLLNVFAGLVLLPFVTYSSLYALTAICFMVPTMVMFPLISPYYNVYHSIVWSTFWVLTGLLYACFFSVDPENDDETDSKKILNSKKLNIYISGLCCFLSLFYNKSNIFWVTLIAFIGIERQTILEHDMNNIWFNNYLKLIQTALEHFKTLVLPYSFSFILYAYLSIKSENSYGLSLHLVQIFYCLCYITFFSLPLWFNQEFIITYLVRTYGNIDRVMVTLLYNILIAATIRFTSYDSILDLEREKITGFVFKKILYRNFFCRYFIALPIYNFSWYTVQELLSNSLLHFPDSLHPLKVHKVSELPLIMTHMSRTLFWICMSGTLISTKLVDSKLYIVPYIIWRVYICPDQNRNIISLLLKEFAWFCLIDVVLFVSFPYMPLA